MLNFSDNRKLSFRIWRTVCALFGTFCLMNCFSCSSMVLDTQPFNVLETSHFTFFYRDGCEIEKDLKKIAKYCENGISWFSTYVGFKIELKPDIYLFDEPSGSFKEPFSDINLDSHSINGTILYYYVEQDYLTAASIILHEAIHVIQDFYFSLDNTALAEGFASFISLKFYYYYLGGSYADKDISELLKVSALQGILAGDGIPEELLKLSLPDFNRTNVLEGDRNAGLRYEIMESFITYLVEKYGIKSVIDWQRNTTVSNFKNNFNKNISADFDECQKKWLFSIGYR